MEIIGIAQEGQTLSVADGPDGTPSYQWQRSRNGVDWVNISDATGSNYIVSEADENDFLRVRASVRAGDGTITTASDPTRKVIDDSSLSVTITGVAQENQVLTANPTILGDEDDQGATVYYQWQSSSDGYSWTDIRCATDSTYTATEADENHFIRVEASFVDDTGQTVTADSDPTCPVIDDASLAVTISGAAKEHQVLTAAPTITGDESDQYATVYYQWQTSSDGYCWADIRYATDSTYTLTEADENHFIRVEASFVDDTGQTITADSDPTCSVIDDASLSVTITGTAQENQILTANPTIVGDEDDQGATVYYQWQTSTDGYCWTDIRCATDSTYTVTEGDENNFIRVEASFVDDTGQTITADSDATSAVIDDASLSVTLTGTAQENQVLTASPMILGDNDDGEAMVSYHWQSSVNGTDWSNIDDATDSTYTVAHGDVGAFIRVEASFTDDTKQLIVADSDPVSVAASQASVSLSVTISGVAQRTRFSPQTRRSLARRMTRTRRSFISGRVRPTVSIGRTSVTPPIQPTLSLKRTRTTSFGSRRGSLTIAARPLRPTATRLWPSSTTLACR